MPSIRVYLQRYVALLELIRPLHGQAPKLRSTVVNRRLHSQPRQSVRWRFCNTYQLLGLNPHSKWG
jgi:hypothetical protein